MPDPFASPAVSAPPVIPTDDITAISGPMIGADQMLVRVNERSRDAHALFVAMRDLRLFTGAGGGATQRGPADHPLISVILEWRDRYLTTAQIVELARGAIAKVDELEVKDDNAAIQIAQLVSRSVLELARYEGEINKTLESLRKAVQEALTWVQKIGLTDSVTVLEEVRRMRAELELERKKVAAGVVTKVAETLRVSAGALMAERRRRQGAVPAEALTVRDDGTAAPTAHAGDAGGQ